MNNLIRQQEEENAKKILLEENKNTQRARPGGILKHQLNAIKEEKYTNTIQKATDEEEGDDAQESDVKCLQRTKVEEKDGDKPIIIDDATKEIHNEHKGEGEVSEAEGEATNYLPRREEKVINETMSRLSLLK